MQRSRCCWDRDAAQHVIVSGEQASGCPQVLETEAAGSCRDSGARRLAFSVAVGSEMMRLEQLYRSSGSALEVFSSTTMCPVRGSGCTMCSSVCF